MKKISAERIAEQAGVSPATVSRVINTPELVHPETCRRVLEVANRLHFPLSGRNRRCRIGLITAFTCDDMPSYFSEILFQFYNHLQKSGYILEILGAGDLPVLKERAFAGIIDLSLAPEILENKSQLPAVPVIRINAPGSPLDGISSILFDAHDCLKKTVDLLWRNGHRKIGFFSWETLEHEKNKPTRRWAGFEEGMRSHGLKKIERFGYFSRDSGYEAVKETLTRALHDGITALIAPISNAALPILRFASEMELRIPEDLSLVLRHGNSLAESCFKRPYLLHSDLAAAAKCASELLEQCIYRHATARNVRLPVELLEGESIFDISVYETVYQGRKRTAGTEQKILRLLEKHSAMSAAEIAFAMGKTLRNGNLKAVLTALRKKRKIEFTEVGNPRSHHQQYRLSRQSICPDFDGVRMDEKRGAPAAGRCPAR